jgi:hypothetical protein
LQGTIVRLNREYGHFRVQVRGDSYFAHMKRVINMPHQCLLADGQSVEFSLGPADKRDYREQAVDIHVIDPPTTAIPTEPQIATIDYWQGTFGFAALDDCKCRVYFSIGNIHTAPEYFDEHLRAGTVVDLIVYVAPNAKGVEGLRGTDVYLRG